MPLPPYIKAELQDNERYQTVYSKVLGSAAAPTAGLHFTPALIERLRRQYPSLAITTEEEPLPSVKALASTKASSNKAADKAPTQSAPTAKGKAEPAA